MRISWGYKIFVGYSLFVVGILFLVYKANTQNFDLVTENYYEAELKYQEVIDQKGRTATLSAAPKISHSVNSVSVQLPTEFASAKVAGQVYLYRPSDASKDIRENFSNATGSCEIKLKYELSGAYQLKLSWQSGGKTFFHESRVFF
jgi:nitrogen fixation protein FixH